MIFALVAVSLLAIADDPPVSVLAQYRDAQAKVGRDADAHIRLALWCESHGLTAERAKHLALATMISPENALARGLLGLVRDGDRWSKPDAVSSASSKAVDPALLAEYLAKKLVASNTEAAQWELAQWCLKNGLKTEAIAHLTAVVRIDPTRSEAWQLLGYKKNGGAWKTDAQIDAERIEASKQSEANHVWKTRLQRLKTQINGKNKQPDAETELAQITDPRSIPAIMTVFVTNKTADQLKAVQLLGQINGPIASRALVALAIYSQDASVRSAAVETLKHRDAREFVGLVIHQLRNLIKYEVKHSDGPGSDAVLFVEGKQYNLRNLYRVQGLTPQIQDYMAQRATNQFIATPGEALYLNNLAAGLGSSQPFSPLTGATAIGSSPAGLNQLNVALAAQNLQAQRDAAIARELNDRYAGVNNAEMALAQAVAPLEQWNLQAAQVNDASTSILKHCTGEDYGIDRVAWQRWWTDAQGYADPPLNGQSRTTEEKPTIEQVFYHSCFAAGTLVKTQEGVKPIESIKVGDAVLSQDLATGGLDFQPVVAVLHNRPSATMKITLNNNTIVATGIHRFWKAGHGWTMARELKPGDAIRIVGGTVKVKSIEPEQVQPVFNLEVSGGHSFFVGQAGALVHDNSLVEPVSEPFDGTNQVKLQTAN